MRIISSKNLELPTVSAEEMKLIDTLMIDNYHIELPQMMENAGRNLADFTESFLRSRGHTNHVHTVVILIGSGGNGGGGLVAARHLLNRGHTVHVISAVPRSTFKPMTAHQASIIEAMGYTIEAVVTLPQCDLILDCLLGYSLNGDPTGSYAAIIKATNTNATPIVSLDTPSGLDVTTGQPQNPCIKADATMTLALPKSGFLLATAQSNLGALYLGDISVPPSLYHQHLNIDFPDKIFFRERVIELMLVE